MDELAITKYLAEDYAKAIKFYDDRARTSKLWYRSLSIYVIGVSALLTPLVAFAPDGICWRITSAVLSATIVISAGLLAHLKCHENWLSYRGSWDALERQRRLFLTGTSVYGSALDKGAQFVERVEAILARESADFFARHAKSEEQTKAPDE
jgi:hypothetical protein